MGASRLKPLTVKELEKLTATKPSTIKHRSLGGVPGFVLVHTPAGHTSYGLIYRANGERKKLTLGSSKMLTLGEARTLAGKYRASVEKGGDPHGDKIEERRQVEVQRHVVTEQQKLDVEALWEKYMQLVASQLRSKGEKDRIFRRYMTAAKHVSCVSPPPPTPFHTMSFRAYIGSSGFSQNPRISSSRLGPNTGSVR